MELHPLFPRTVHPRACGERSQAMQLESRRAGASPRMRGTGPLHRLAPGLDRCIPAHAGNGMCTTLTPNANSVHARACGERQLGSVAEPSRDGASPRMRGTVPASAARHSRARCIPAHAGNGWSASRTLFPTSVHPRACGERVVGEVQARARHGASPRMRGTALHSRWSFYAVRCIPAHAGNGFGDAVKGFHVPVHPRACGERETLELSFKAHAGASPRMRGTDGLAWPQVVEHRCIPAHAGNGLKNLAPLAHAAVHPRACGERGCSFTTRRVCVGASPRMRGTDHRGDDLHASGRCIPAHAGNG